MHNHDVIIKTVEHATFEFHANRRGKSRSGYNNNAASNPHFASRITSYEKRKQILLHDI